MAGRNSLAGSKRKATDPLVGRPSKVRRTLDFNLDNGYSINGGDIVFSGSSKPVSPFRHVSLIAMPLSEEKDEQHLFEQALREGYVPAAGFTVSISWASILSKICQTIGLDIIRCDVVDGLDGGFCGVIEMEVPVIAIYPAKERRVFYGDDKVFRCDAEESVCETAVSYLQRNCGVRIKDANFLKVNNLESRATRAEFFLDCFEELVEKECIIALREKYVNNLNQIKEACSGLINVLSLGTVSMIDNMNGDSGEKLLYVAVPGISEVVAKHVGALVMAINKASVPSGEIP